MANRLPEVERQYFIRKLGVNAPNTKPLNQIKREYFEKTLGAGTAQSPFNELERQWVRSVLATAGVTAATKYESELWKLMVISISQTPQRTIDQNKIIFYTNAS